MALAFVHLVGLLAFTWVIFITRYVWCRFFSYQGIPTSIPWIGAPDGSPFSRAKSALKSFFGLREMLLNGYREYSKRDKVFILPNIVNGHEVIIPTHYMNWLLEQPDTVLSQFETNRQFMCGDYTMLQHDMIRKDKWSRLSDIVKREMTRDIDDYVDDIVDEVQDSLKSLWGSNTEEWHEINVYDVMSEVVARVVNRVFVGLPLCRNPGYVQASMGFSKYILLWAMGIEMLPRLLKPLVAPILTAYDYMVHYKRMSGFVTPLFRDRVSRHFKEPTAAAKQPNDYIQWVVRDLVKRGLNPQDDDPDDMVSKQLAITSFTAIQSSAITITNALVDISATPPSIEVQESLRAELLSIPAKNKSWTRASLSKLPKLDSVLTETLRLWGILTHGVTKAVVAPEGVTLPSGEHIPCGAKVGIASYGPHLDEEIYGQETSPFVFDAFRFTRNCHKKKGAPPGLSFITTGEYYMGFSHGRFACPGRFFANSLLKILLAHITLMYDLEPIEDRPANPWLNNTIGPPIGTKIRVRRRKVDADTFQPLTL
ncbi:cytochrome P450 [Apodospora peruviana]|uniref:Cytochrome P450 n=1 Tax=Apodospora peruviana TaxID=516989 RepID=A0AAE0HSF4_9PEZI|nr:cytochrome P450 [Apodospora peruviana]